MAEFGLPKLPGYTFNGLDVNLTSFHKPQTFDIYNGYFLPKVTYKGIGGQLLASNKVKHKELKDSASFDPSLVYGRARSKSAYPQFRPQYATYDRRCLRFDGYFKESVSESPWEHYRVRKVKITYFLEDDTLMVTEPKILNSGLQQGKLVRRGKIPKPKSGFWHWKDLQVGIDMGIYGIIYHTVNCDVFTRQYMESQGLLMNDAEVMPEDPYMENRKNRALIQIHKTPSLDDKARKFYEFDGKVLRFYALWDDRDTELGDIRKFELLYYLADNTIALHEVHYRNDGRDRYGPLLKKTKVAKNLRNTPVDFPSLCLEFSDAEYVEFYQPKDFKVGSHVTILGRNLFLYDCDEFTRSFFKKFYCIEQDPAINVDPPKRPQTHRPIAPYDRLGSLEDSIENTKKLFDIRPPRKDLVKQLANANKYLRYEMRMDDIHPEDSVRRFLLYYSLADDTCQIYEPPLKNSGIRGGKYLKKSLLIKPGSDPLNPTYYTPIDFYIGAPIMIFNQKFIITGADLHVYKYMQDNPEKFPCEVIESIRNYMCSKGYLKEDIKERMEDISEAERKAALDAMGRQYEYKGTEMEKCIQEAKMTEDVRDAMQQYDGILLPSFVRRKHDGVAPVSNTCAYPVVSPEQQAVCDVASTDFMFSKASKDISEEKRKTDQLLRDQQDLCRGVHDIPCAEPTELPYDNEPTDKYRYDPLIIRNPIKFPTTCGLPKFKFVDQFNKCSEDVHDLCKLKGRDFCDCSIYKKKYA